MSERKQFRQLQVSTSVQRIPGVPDGQVGGVNKAVYQHVKASNVVFVLQSAHGQGASGETGVQGPDGPSCRPQGPGPQRLTRTPASDLQPLFCCFGTRLQSLAAPEELGCAGGAWLRTRSSAAQEDIRVPAQNCFFLFFSCVKVNLNKCYL